MTRTDPGACNAVGPYAPRRPDCGCGHGADFHGGSTPKVIRKPCSVADPAKCLCPTYTATVEDR